MKILFYGAARTVTGSKHFLTLNNGSQIETLKQWIKKTCIEKWGKLIIPAFSVGRTQEVLYALNR